MLHSMTGFAREIAETPSGTLTCELRAVNHRYLDVQFRMPDELRVKETELRQQVAEVIKRGKVECSLHLRRGAGETKELAIDSNLVRQIASRIREVADILPHSSSPDPMDLLRWPGVVLEPEIETDSLFEDASAVIGDTLRSLAAMRRSEGERITAMLESRCSDIRRIAGDVRKRMPKVLEAIRARQKERLAALDIDADPDRLESELALVAQKLDVDEELDRLDSHVVEILDVIRREEPVGRRLDFLMQELNREANTLGSKSADTETTRAAVELKVLVEQMREQIQNVE
jgi:uncharacterized protein (TIGR00255 family)